MIEEKLTREALVNWFYRQSAVRGTKRSCDILVERLVSRIVRELMERGSWGLVGWGRLTIKIHKAKRNFNPQTGEYDYVGPRHRIHFRPGWKLKNKLRAMDKSLARAQAAGT